MRSPTSPSTERPAGLLGEGSAPLPAFQPLVSRVRSLGNPARRYLRTVDKNGERLLARLEARGLTSQVHLDRTAPGLADDFARVASAGQDPDETLCLLGTFYAVQFLHQNARALERLAVDLAEGSDRLGAFAAFLERTAEEFALLVSSYADHVLRLVMPEDAGSFALLNVGTPSHQDDIDVAVLARAPDRRGAVDRGIARLSTQFLRYASPLDNYVAVQIDAEGFAVTLEELWEALGTGGLGFVVVTELLRAELLAGDRDTLERLRDHVMVEYLYRPGRDNTRHELYLRGLLGETRALLLRPPPPDLITPKDDALRLILGLATALRTIEGVGAAQPGEVVARFMARHAELRAPLTRLEESRVFLETFRQVAQLLIAEEEEISVEGDAARENLGRVARALGYRDWGPVRAVDHLLVHYHEAVDDARGAAVAVMDYVARHLTEVSSFSTWTRGPCPDDLASELGEALVAAARAFRGVRFFDDLIEAFAAPGGARLLAFERSYAALPAARRAELANLYAEWGRDAPYTILSLLAMLARRPGRSPGIDPVDEIAAALLDQLGASVEAVRGLSRVFRTYPELVNRFLFALKPARLERLASAIDVPIGSPEVSAARDAFRALVEVHLQSSRYIKRVLARVTERHPRTVQAISDEARLRTLALGRLASSERHPSPDTQKGLLGDFYDIEFLRIAMDTLHGGPAGPARAAFSDLTRTYLGRLFDICCREVERESGDCTFERDRFALLLSGGTARGRPFDEDYDLLALIDADQAGPRRFAERAIVLMNAQIARRGVIAQYRLAEWLGRYVATLDELADLLAGDDDVLFVDRCQLLGSRMIVGSRRIGSRLAERVLSPQIFGRADEFARRVAREIRERRESGPEPCRGVVHLKESPGGLREIDLVLAMAKARLGVWETPSRAFAGLAAIDPKRAASYRRLAQTHDFLVAVRSAYRVTVAATDEVERGQLAAPARILGNGGPRGGLRLFDRLRRQLDTSARLVDEVSAGLTG